MCVLKLTSNDVSKPKQSGVLPYSINSKIFARIYEDILYKFWFQYFPDPRYEMRNLFDLTQHLKRWSWVERKKDRLHAPSWLLFVEENQISLHIGSLWMLLKFAIPKKNKNGRRFARFRSGNSMNTMRKDLDSSRAGKLQNIRVKHYFCTMYEHSEIPYRFI